MEYAQRAILMTYQQFSVVSGSRTPGSGEHDEREEGVESILCIHNV